MSRKADPAFGRPPEETDKKQRRKSEDFSEGGLEKLLMEVLHVATPRAGLLGRIDILSEQRNDYSSHLLIIQMSQSSQGLSPA